MASSKGRPAALGRKRGSEADASPWRRQGRQLDVKSSKLLVAVLVSNRKVSI